MGVGGVLVHGVEVVAGGIGMRRGAVGERAEVSPRPVRDENEKPAC